jgi:hypothetical protein
MEKTSFKDFFLNRIFSRKLIVWIVGTFLLCFGLIDQNTWLILSLGYVSVNGVLTALDVAKTSKDKVMTKIQELKEPTEEGSA